MKQRKKRNPQKTLARMLNGAILYAWDTDGPYVTGMIKTPFKTVEMDEKIVRTLINQHLNWAVCARVLCKYQDGTEKMHTSICSAEKVQLNDLMPVFLDIMKELKDSQKQADIVDVGWIAKVWSNENLIDDEKWCNTKVGPVNELRRDVYRSMLS